MSINLAQNIFGINPPNHPYVDQFPDTCPVCNTKVIITPERGHVREPIAPGMMLVFRCPNLKCQSFFIGYYNVVPSVGSSYSYSHSLPKTIAGRTFENEITEISPDFVAIYHQAQSAEDSGLMLICGVGYRKALEFILKDYLIARIPAETDEIKQQEADAIKKKLLGKCIEDYVDNPNLKNVAKRAAWLGNDETHYERKWIDKDLKDLKMLIDLTLHWILIQIHTDRYVEEMP
jgi:hypothetical protein